MPLGAIFRFILFVFSLLRRAFTSTASAIGGLFGAAGAAGASIIGGPVTGQGLTDFASSILTIGTQATLLNEAGALNIFGGKSGAVQTFGNLISNPFVLGAGALGLFFFFRNRDDDPNTVVISGSDPAF